MIPYGRNTSDRGSLLVPEPCSALWRRRLSPGTALVSYTLVTAAYFTHTHLYKLWFLLLQSPILLALFQLLNSLPPVAVPVMYALTDLTIAWLLTDITAKKQAIYESKPKLAVENGQKGIAPWTVGALYVFSCLFNLVEIRVDRSCCTSCGGRIIPLDLFSYTCLDIYLTLWVSSPAFPSLPLSLPMQASFLLSIMRLKVRSCTYLFYHCASAPSIEAYALLSLLSFSISCAKATRAWECFGSQWQVTWASTRPC